MTGASILFIAVAIVFAVLDWVSVARGIVLLEYISKPAATLFLLATAAALDVAHGATWGWRLAALAFCVVGDVFLMLPRDAFVPGLASFAVAQVLFTVSFLVDEAPRARVVTGLVIIVPAALFLARRFVGAIRRSGHGELAAPVMAYMTVISAMTVGAIGTGSVVALAGAVTFMVSDSLIAESLFVNARGWHPVGIMVMYHLALAGLVVDLL